MVYEILLSRIDLPGMQWEPWVDFSVVVYKVTSSHHWTLHIYYIDRCCGKPSGKYWYPSYSVHVV